MTTAAPPPAAPTITTSDTLGPEPARNKIIIYKDKSANKRKLSFQRIDKATKKNNNNNCLLVFHNYFE